ncbi:MAG TPA: VWA domain-containing protein [Spirochaetota bacterium]|nr:VWA domain-containing protein [Spirochaetota bacterium]
MKGSSRFTMFFLGCLCMFCFLGQSDAAASSNKDVILILDTSYSMIGSGGGYKAKNIFEDVKGSIASYIDNLEDGDRVTFMTFDTAVRVFPTIFVDDDNDRDILKKYISMTQAKGLWTNTYYMIQAAFSKAESLETEEDNDRQIVIVVMTDGIDDPAPDSLDKRLNIKEISSRYSNKDWWVYLVNLSELRQTKKVAILKKELDKVTKHATIIEAGKDPAKGIQQDLQKDIEDKDTGTGDIILTILLVLIIIAAILGLIYFFTRYSSLRVTGILEYWSSEVLDPYITNVNLTKKGARTVYVGKGFDSTVTIRDIQINVPFEISAVRVEKRAMLKISTRGSYSIDFVNKEQGQYLESGDIFKVSNYTFKYSSEA